MDPTPLTASDDPLYRGRMTPKHLKDGPLDDRKCTDFLCFIIFGAFWFGVVSIAGAALHEGNPQNLTHPWDQFGNPCGASTETNGYPYLFWIQDDSDGFNITNTVCVDSCPVGANSFSSNDCAPDFINSGQQCSDLTHYDTTPLEYFCLPTDSGFLTTLMNSTGSGTIDFGFTYQAVADLKATWWMIIVVGVIALIFGFIYLTLMRYFSGVIIWSLLIIWVIIWSAFAFICIEDGMGADIADLTPKALIGANSTWLYIVGGTSAAVAFISLILVCCFKSRINLAVAVLKAAADYLEDEKGVLFIPPFFFITNIIFYVFWIFVAVYIFSMNEVVAAENNFPAPDINWTVTTTTMMTYHVLSLFWNHAFSVSLAQFIISSSVCLWYFSQGKSNVEQSTIWKSIKRSFYHLGSIALGSFIIAIVEIIKFIMEYISNKVKKDAPIGAGAKTAGYCVTCCTCLVDCFDQSLKFVSRHAYIQIAMTGENFCTATEDAFHLLVRNALRFGTVHGLSWVFMKLGELVVSLGATFIGYLVITNADYFEEHIYSPIVPSVLFFLSSLSVAHVFMSVYGTSADTIIHCFAMDEEIHDGEVKYAPKELRDFVDNHAGVRKLTLNEY